MTLCSWASGGALRKIVMTSSSWSLQDEVITNVETPGTVRPTTRRLTPEDWKPTRINIHKSYFPSTQRICFVWISEQTAIISLYSSNWLVFITETECVYCAVRAGSLYSARFNIHIFYVLPTLRIYVFCMDLRTNSDYLPIQH